MALFDLVVMLRFFLPVRAPASTQDTVGLNMSCLAESGQPIFPWISLGGYKGRIQNLYSLFHWLKIVCKTLFHWYYEKGCTCINFFADVTMAYAKICINLFNII